MCFICGLQNPVRLKLRIYEVAPGVVESTYTAKLEVKYRRHVPIGKPLKIVGRAGRDRGRSAEAWAGIYDETGELLAEGNTLLVAVPQDLLDNANLEELGWKVYPEG